MVSDINNTSVGNLTKSAKKMLHVLKNEMDNKSMYWICNNVLKNMQFFSGNNYPRIPNNDEVIIWRKQNNIIMAKQSIIKYILCKFDDHCQLCNFAQIDCTGLGVI